jgi:hypothetical protein
MHTEAKKHKGGQKETWLRTIKKDLERAGLTMEQAVERAKD